MYQLLLNYVLSAPYVDVALVGCELCTGVHGCVICGKEQVRELGLSPLKKHFGIVQLSEMIARPGFQNPPQPGRKSVRSFPCKGLTRRTR